jgi:cytidine diphosphoramidate kinase
MVIWIIGMSGSGKTTIANKVVERIRNMNEKVVLLDGDIIRALFSNDVDHTVNGRRRNAERISYLSKYLADQKIHVVAAVLSIFPEWQDWNRENIDGYTEIYVKADMETLLRRDIKDLYAKALNGDIDNVVGVDIPFPEPEKSDLILDNNIDRDDLSEFVDSILNIDRIKKSFS